jgi:hypothetical protein
MKRKQNPHKDDKEQRSSKKAQRLRNKYRECVRATLQSESEGSILARENQRVRLLN